MRILIFLPLTFALPAIKSSSPESPVARPGTPALSDRDFEFQVYTPSTRKRSGVVTPRPVRPTRPGLTKFPGYDLTVSETPAKHAFEKLSEKEVKKEGADTAAKKSPLSIVNEVTDFPVFEPTVEEEPTDIPVEEQYDDPMEGIEYTSIVKASMPSVESTYSTINMTPPQTHEDDPDCMDES